MRRIEYQLPGGLGGASMLSRTLKPNPLVHICRIEYQLPGGPWRYACEPAAVGEFWHDDYVASLLAGPCGRNCANISILPIFDMTLPRHMSHHGSLGRGSAQGRADCRHWCNNIVDQWSVLLYNLVC